MIRFLFIALGALFLPAILYYMWRVFVPERFGGSTAMAHGEWQPMPWRWLMGIGTVLLALTIGTMVSFSGPPEPPPAARSGTAAPSGN